MFKHMMPVSIFLLIIKTHTCLKIITKNYFLVSSAYTFKQLLFFINLAAATEEPEVIPDPAKQTDRVVKIAGISAGILVFILLLLVVILIVKKR